MRQETFTAAGVDLELMLLRDSSSRHWLVIARWRNEKDELSTHTLPPLAPDLTEELAWREARSWAVKRLTREMLEAGGVKTKFSVPT
ncbi:hypothetical protein OCT51_11190 [Halomonas sp. LR3S48]|uniref:hypothetical protein n=1 Tax=Halomonas sp. LR3S48 TaxID=2982694 RepID=UPI0021E3B604|nr:hypothetical protein [Halomonas sp. LR3S48]UYG01778.1 hypothetical protein OCT51_11190 [Halomonas sp. LR3S48]